MIANPTIVYTKGDKYFELPLITTTPAVSDDSELLHHYIYAGLTDEELDCLEAASDDDVGERG